jgi:carbon-monoxide dehydrogenase large subunit
MNDADHGGGSTLVGRRIRRLEDPPLLRGAAAFLDDIAPAGALHAAFVRSEIAHGIVRSIDPSAAQSMGAIVFTAADLGEANGPRLHPKWSGPSPALLAASEMEIREPSIQLLATDRVRHVGEAVAIVLAADPYRARDAAAAVVVEIDPLATVADAARAVAPDAERLYPDWPDNVTARFRLTAGDWSAAVVAADVVVEGEYQVGRASASPIEPRGVVAVPGPAGQPLLVYSGNQIPSVFRDAVATAAGLERESVVVRAPETGGGFGLKGMIHPEELAVPVVAARLNRPVKWTATRHEELLTGAHARDQVHRLELAVRRDGTVLGLRDRYLIDAGSVNALGITVPYNTASHLRGPYRIPVADIEATVVVTNRSPVAAYRGAGRPEAVFALERALDRAAAAIGLDPVELRRRNLLREDELPLQAGIPYRDGHPLVMDIGAPGPCLEEALEALDFAGFRREQATARAAGRRLGLGVASYVEGTGIGPPETAVVTADVDGRITVMVATSAQGQGHRTTLAQVAADALGVPLESVRVRQGDTSLPAQGNGAVASRTMVVAGNAVAEAGHALSARLHAGAADLLEASAADIVAADGRLGVVGTESAVGIGDVVRHLLADEPGASEIAADGRFAPATVTFAHGVHAAIVELDPITGGVTLLRYVVVHDAGRVANPLVVDGQVAGGVVQGIGAALSEGIRYADDGQLLTGTLADYRLPRATDVPDIEMVHRETRSERNPLGFKGVGEAGVIAAPVAVVNAVADAIGPRGGELVHCPVAAEDVLRLLSTDAPA